MRKSYGGVGAVLLVFLASAIGCSDDSENDPGDGDGDSPGTGGFVTTTGGSSSGDGDVLDPCFGALVYCDNGCVDLTADHANCGACGERCASDQVCEESTCVEGPPPSDGGAGGRSGFGGSAGSLN
jgi:hypothetical protein